MRLLDTTTLDVVSFAADKIPPYAILSHTWGTEQDEPTFQQIQELTAVARRDPTAWSRHPTVLKKGYKKLRGACSLALSQKYRYVWVDTCCIDKTSSSELSEAINSMYRWYEGAAVCYVFLEDVDVGPGIVNPDISQCRWFTRGWTLQELVAPRNVQFYDYKWSYVGSKHDRPDFRVQLARTTAIDSRVLLGNTRIDELGVASRMSWAAARTTTRPEDMAYCLMGIFQVSMPLLYGEGGERAFLRLQEEILRSVNDHSLFAWTYPSDDPPGRQLSGLLASSPKYFRQTGHIMPSLPDLSLESAPSSVTNAGLHVQLYLRPARDAWMSGMENEVHADYVAVLDCAPVTFGKREYYCGIRLVDLGSGQFARTRSDSLMLRELSKHFSGGKLLADDLKYVYVKQNPMWILPEVMLPEPQGETTEVTCRLVEACPWSRWVQDMRILRSGQSHDGRVVGGFRYNVAQTAGTVDQFDVFVIVQGTEGQLGDWTAVACVERVQTGQSLEEAFAEVSKRARLRRSSKVGTYLAAASSEKLLPHGVRPFVEKVKSGGKTSIVLKWSHTQPEAASTHEVDGTEIFGTGRIVSTANLLQDRAEVDHQLALTRRMACEVVCDSIDITVRQSVNIVSQLPSKIRTTRPGDWSNLREQLSTMLREIKGQASEIQVSAEDGSELDVFGQYFANRLMVACICGDIAAARELVKTKLVTVPLECKVSGRSFQDKELCAAFLAFRAIHWAAIFGHTEIVRLLTENGADRYSKTVTGFTSVHLAAMMGHGGLVEYLLNSWTPAELADLDRLRRGRLNEAPGHLAAAYDRSDDGPSLFRAYERGTITKDHNIASVLGARNGLGETPLHRAAAMNNTGAIRIIATALPGADAQEGLKASLDSPDGYGRTPLWHAAATGADEAIKHLLHLSATVDSPDVYGRTPLHIACREGHPKAVQILLEAGADVNRLTTAPCLSARHFAALAADIECLELLIQHGGKADLREMEGVEFGAVHIAAANGWLEGVKLLVKHGCGPNTSCSHYVRARGHSQIDGAVNVARIRYNNAMELAVRGGHGDLVEFLKGAESDR